MATRGALLGAGDMSTPKFSGVVLAGGGSTRMGTDKALIAIDDRRLIEVSTDALRRAGASEIFVVGGSRPDIEDLGLRWVADEFPGEGPLGAVITALGEAAEETVVILACDHVGTADVAVLSVVGAIGDSDVAVPWVSGQPQVLHAAWRRRVEPRLRRTYERGGRSLRSSLKGLTVRRVEDVEPAWFDDADAPSDLPGNMSSGGGGRSNP